MSDPDLSKRERQIMDLIYAQREATATTILDCLDEPANRSAVRTFLRILEEKGHLTHRKEGREFVYRPTKPRGRVGKSALRRVLDVFFEGSLEKAVAAHLSDPSARLTPQEAKRLEDLIRQSRTRPGQS